MEYLIISADHNAKTTFSNEVTTSQEDECKVIDVRTCFKRKDIVGCYREEIFSEFKIGYGDFTICEKCHAQLQFTGQTIEMLFFFEGKYLIQFDCASSTIHCQQNLLYYSSSKQDFTINNGTLSFVKVNFSPYFLQKFLPNEIKLKDFRQKIKPHPSKICGYEEQLLKPEIFLILKEIQQSKRKGFYRKINMHALVLKLLLLQLDSKKSIGKSNLRNTDEEKIIEIRDYIAANYTQPLTLQLLSKKFTTNEFALKKGFKAVVGTTVFSYILDLKMNEAKKLLLEQGLTVGEVADRIGYKNPQHFSTAFKKKFGISPSKL